MQLHSFHWALRRLAEGRKIRLDRWGEGAYVQVNEHNIAIFYYTIKQCDLAFPGNTHLLGSLKSWSQYKFCWNDTQRNGWHEL